MHSYGKPDMTFTWSWIGHDMGPAVTALFKNYTTRLAEIEKQTFVVGSGRVTAEEMAVELAKGALLLSSTSWHSTDGPYQTGLGKPVEVQHLDKSGMPPIDDMVSMITF